MSETGAIGVGLADTDDIPLADEDGEEVKSEPVPNRNGQPQEVGDHRDAGAMEEQLFFEEENHDGSAFSSLDHSLHTDEIEEKSRLISQVLELQNTLDDLSQRVDSVKEENLKLKSENGVLGQYIENLMAASSVFQSTQQQPSHQHNRPPCSRNK
ncbi:short coiled-coil protein-like isoform X2 [Varroa jacobsoni]|uniref:Short coiled-coil protein A n=2 Tax=Varroa TaxID=62624 RepID=A0A7M7KR68_VARDE|nr:short coiled-coil protein-like [Varroa destructor]XP_022696512.1 short coiled-coil protein-like isoform X2 [Varroa jacobsoni]